MTLRDLSLRLRALVAPRRVEQELDEELAFHIDRETRKLLDTGMDASAARREAMTRFGPVSQAAEKCRDARGTSFVDTLVRDTVYAFRTFRRAPLAALTIVATVALGLGLVTVVFTFYNALFLRADAVRNPHELFEVKQLPSPGARAWMPLTRVSYEEIRRDTSVFEDSAAILDDMSARVDGRPIGVTLVTGSFFQMLGATAAVGRPLTPADDRQPVVVLSHQGWIRLFADEPPAAGRHLRLNGVDYEIVGVMRDGFRGLRTSAPDGWAPLALAGGFRPEYAGKEDTIAISVIGRLKPGESVDTARAGLALWAQQRGLEREPGRPVSMALWPTSGTISQDTADTLKTFVPLFFTFGLILLIACANVANLLLARGVSRQREIGIRLSLGASRGRIVRQLLTESVLLALASAACGFAVCRLFLLAGLQAINNTMPPEVAEAIAFQAPAADWRVVLFLVGAAFVSTALFGLVPALQATRFELVRTIHGQVMRDVRPRRARNALIAVQVGAAALLLISAAVFLRGAIAASRENVGLRSHDTVVVDIAGKPRRPAIRQALESHSLVTAAAAVSKQRELAGATAVTGGTESRLPVDCMFVSAEYLDVLDIPILKGRGFNASEGTLDAGVAVISEDAAQELWPNGDAVGQTLRLDEVPATPGMKWPRPPQPSRVFTVIGVTGNVRGSFLVFDLPLMFDGIYLPAAPESPGMSMVLRVQGDPDRARLALLDSVARIDPSPTGIRTLRTMTGMQAYMLRVAFGVTLTLGAIALALTLSGLFSVLSYIVEQRRKEIGVRIALGATMESVVRLVVAQSLLPVGGGLVAGGGLAAAVAIVLLSLPIAWLVNGIVHVLDPVAYAAAFLVIVIACVAAAAIPAIRAARMDPIVALRQD